MIVYGKLQWRMLLIYKEKNFLLLYFGLEYLNTFLNRTNREDIWTVNFISHIKAENKNVKWLHLQIFLKKYTGNAILLALSPYCFSFELFSLFFFFFLKITIKIFEDNLNSTLSKWIQMFLICSGLPLKKLG